MSNTEFQNDKNSHHSETKERPEEFIVKSDQISNTKIHLQDIQNRELLPFDFQLIEKFIQESTPNKEFSALLESAIIKIAMSSNRESFKELRIAIEKYPDIFYFKLEPTAFDGYYTSLISINTMLNIDDLIYEYVSKIHSKRKSFKEIVTLLKRICFILKTKELSRPLLKHIFDNIVYLDFDWSFISDPENVVDDVSLIFYKYSILNLIIQQYKEISREIELLKIRKAIDQYNPDILDKLELQDTDILTDLDKLKNLTLKSSREPEENLLEKINDSFASDKKLQVFSSLSERIRLLEDNLDSDKLIKITQTVSKFELPNLLNTNLINKQKPFQFIKDSDTAKDNAEVLANIIWENTFYIIEAQMPIPVSTGLPDKFNLQKSLSKRINSFEINCIVSLYTTIVKETGCFFENRILRNSSLFSKICNQPSFLPFCDSLICNFRNEKKLYEITKCYLGNINTSESNRILDRFKDLSL